MNIVIFIGTLSGGGAERVVSNLSNYLCNHQHHVTILNFEKNKSEYFLEDKVERSFLVQNPKSNIVKRAIYHFFHKGVLRLRLRRFLSENQKNTDIYLAMLEHPTIMLLENRRFVKKPIVISERNYPQTYSGFFRKKLSNLCRFADGYVFQTKLAQEWYGCNVKNSIIIPNAVNDEFIAFPLFSGLRKKKIVNVGRLTEQKNQKLLIKAFSMIEDQEYVLEIFGLGPLENDLKRYINELNLQDRVYLKGFSENITADIMDATAFVLTSTNEGLPNALIEAMALGLPCVTTDFAGGGAHTLIRNLDNGIIVSKFEAESIKNAITLIIKDRDFQKKLSLSAYSSIRQFASQIIYSKWEKYLKFIMEKYENEKNSSN